MLGFYEGFTGNIVRGDSFVIWFAFFTGFLVGFWIYYASSSRRLHDMDQNVWMQAIPLVNIVVFIMMLFKASADQGQDEVVEGDPPIASRSTPQGQQILAVVLIVIVSAFYAFTSLEDVAMFAE